MIRDMYIMKEGQTGVLLEERVIIPVNYAECINLMMNDKKWELRDELISYKVQREDQIMFLLPQEVLHNGLRYSPD